MSKRNKKSRKQIEVLAGTSDFSTKEKVTLAVGLVTAVLGIIRELIGLIRDLLK